MRHFLLPGLALFGLTMAASEPTRRIIDSKRYHLGVAGNAEWSEFEATPPHGPQLDLTFSASVNSRESTLLVRQRNVKAAWNVLLNGQKIGTLEPLSQPLVRALAIPAGALRTGENRLTISRTPSRVVDDVVVGEIALDGRPRAEAVGAVPLRVTVTDSDGGGALPCRLTLVDAEGALIPLHVAPEPNLAVRTGVVYTGNGQATVGLAPGEYTLYASRGFEYDAATRKIRIAPGKPHAVALKLRREVPTPGWVAADSHIHTLTHSKHGDATIDERMVTIAGEAIEVAVATDHNHHVDYTEAAQRTGMTPHFHSVVGNEVSTKVGHFNAFPIRPGSPIPDAQLTDWTQLLHHIRSVTGAQVVTLNHPRDVHSNFTPLGPEQFDATTGAFKKERSFGVDAIEVVTSAAMQSDLMLLYRDWFALLNHGYRVAAVGSSDTHHVSEFILGQSRTYVACRDQALRQLDLNEVWSSYRAGRLLVSMGLLAHVQVDGKFGVGDLATGVGAELNIAVEVLGPSWVTADRVELFANGVKVREQRIAATERVTKARVTWKLTRPSHDVHLVVVATGPGVTAPYWEISRPYQPTAKVFTPRVVGSTNPVWIDADGDGRFTPARGYATRLVQDSAGDRAKLGAALGGFDEAVAVQVRDLTREAR